MRITARCVNKTHMHGYLRPIKSVQISCRNYTIEISIEWLINCAYLTIGKGVVCASILGSHSKTSNLERKM